MGSQERAERKEAGLARSPWRPESHGPPEASASRKLGELLGKLRCKVLRPFCETGTIKYRSPRTKTDPLQHLFLVTKRN